MLDWINENKEWLFSGVGVTLFATITTIVALVFRRKRIAKPGQQQSSGQGSVNIQAQKAFSTEAVFLRTFFQGNLYIVHETILIVVGTSIGAERYDRVLAQLLKRILHKANIEAEIITDILYLREIKRFESSPVISIGSRGTNQLVNKYEEEFELKDRETTAKVFTDGQRPLAFIYGGGVKETYDATIQFFRQNKLIVFVDTWSSRYTKGKKTIKMPSNIEESLREIIFVEN